MKHAHARPEDRAAAVVDVVVTAAAAAAVAAAMADGVAASAGSRIQKRPTRVCSVANLRRSEAVQCSATGKNGQGWIRTSEGVSQQIYSLPRLATSVPTLFWRTEHAPGQPARTKP